MSRIAFNIIARRSRRGRRSISIRPGLLTEDVYVANKLMKGFIGSANMIDTNSWLCMASSIAGHRRAFGADTVPGCYEDLDQADLLVLVGSNAAWCYIRCCSKRMLVNKQARALHRRDRPAARRCRRGCRTVPGLGRHRYRALFAGLLAYLADNGALDRDYIERHTTGFDDAIAPASPAAWPAACGRRR